MTLPGFAKRSPVYRRLQKASSSETTGGAQGVGALALRLADLSLLPRWGVKGRDASSWLESKGAAIPSRDNTAARQPDGSLIGRLSPGEALILSSIPAGQSALAQAIETLPAEGLGACYPVPRGDSHHWFVVTGADASRTFAKICGVDLAPEQFPNGAIAQTSVARLSAVVIRNDIAGAAAFSVLSDSASAEYLWDCLLDAIAEFSGVVVGVESLRVGPG